MPRDELVDAITAELGADASETIEAFRDIEKASESASSALTQSSKEAEQQVAKSAKSISDIARNTLRGMGKALEGLNKRTGGTRGAFSRLWDTLRFGAGRRAAIKRSYAALPNFILGLLGKAASTIASGVKTIWEAIPIPDLDLGASVRKNIEDVQDVTPELDEVTGKVERFSDSMEEAERESGGLILKLGALAAAAAATASAIVGFGVRAIRSMSELAESVDLPIDKFSVLRQGVQNLGVRGGAVDAALQQLSGSLDDMGDTSTEAGAALEALGITAEDPREALLQLADTLERTRDSEDRTRAVTVLLGDSARELIPALEGGRDALVQAEEAARGFGAEIGTKAERDANRFTRNLRVIQARIKGTSDSLKLWAASGALPYLNDITDATREGIEQGNIFTGVWHGLRRTVELARGAAVEEDPFGVQVAVSNVELLRGRIQSLREDYEAWTGYENVQAGIERDIEYFAGLLETAEERLGEVRAEAEQAVVQAATAAPLEEVEFETEEQRRARVARVEAQEAAVAALERELALLGAVTAEERALAEVEEGRYKEFDDAAKDQVQALQVAIEAEKERIRLADEQLKAQQALEQQADAQIESLEAQIDLGERSTRAERLRYELSRGRFAALEGEQRAELEALATRLQALDVERQRAEESEKARALAEDEIQKLQEQIALVRARTEAERAGVELSAERYAALTEEERAQIANLRVSLDRERQAQRVLATLDTLEDKRRRELQAIRDLAVVNEEVRAREADLIAAVNERYDSMAEKTGEVADKIESDGERAAKSLQDAFAQFLFDPFEEGLDGMLLGFIDTMRQILAERISAGIFGQDGGGGGEGGGGGGLAGALGSFLSFDEGGGVPGSGPVAATVHGGEYVVRAAAVRAYGAQLFEGLNRMALPKVFSPRIDVTVPRVPSYADGGLVAEPAAAGAGGAQVDLAVINVMSREAALEALASRQGKDIILNQIGSDGGHQVRRILGS